MKVTGSCHCGAIAYEAQVDPGAVGVCHCTDCQRLTGTAFRTTVAAPADGFRLLKGAPKIYVKTADSGTRRAHAFCGDCGGPVYATTLEDPKTYSLRLGALDQRAELGPPRRQVWTRRRLAWTLALNEIPAFDGQP